MKKNVITVLIFLILSALAILNCGGPDEREPLADRPPTLDPIPDIIVYAGETVTIEPFAHDPDGNATIVSYSGWMNSNTYTTIPNDRGEHTVTVTANDGILDGSVDVNIIVMNNPPVITIVDFTPVQAEVELLTQLTGSYEDYEGDSLSITWTLLTPSNSSTPLFDDDTDYPYFTPDLEGEYRVTLIVTDGIDNSIPYSVVINVGPITGRVNSKVLDIAGGPATTVNYQCLMAAGQPGTVGISSSTNYVGRFGFIHTVIEQGWSGFGFIPIVKE